MFTFLKSFFYKRPNIQHLPEPFIVADLETTGLDSNKHEIIEIAAIKVNRDSNNHVFFTGLVKPKKKIPAKITSITGITNEMVETDGEAIESIIPQFLNFIEELRLVFYNAPFDMSFLNKAASDLGIKIKNPISDALTMSRQAWPNLPSYKLTDLAKMGNLDTSGAHRALEDCKMTMTVYGAASTLLKRA